jgi:hypothetical protein
MTSLATRRLAAIRAATPQGIRAGGYGWVENLQPSAIERNDVPAPSGERGPLTAFADDSGFIHAPSLAHASTAALLRNAHLGSGTQGQADQPFAIDLSSRRARDAGWLLEAMRQGQPLGAVLGYRLERRLHELGHHRFVAPLRDMAPLSARKLQPSDLPLEVIAANNVIDGSALFEQWQHAPSSVTTGLQQAGASGSDVEAIVREIRDLGDTIDAVTDALTAETAYQLVRGNTARTATTLKAIAAGEAPPPELEVTRTPRSGTALTHRVVLLLSGADGATPGWAPASTSPRASANPTLNAWAARLLGDPTKVRCFVERLADSGSTVAQTHVFPLSALAVTPLDVVYAVNARRGADAAAPPLSPLEERVLYHARRATHGFSADAPLSVQSRPADLAPGELSLFDVIEQAAALRALLAGARAVDLDDLQPPDRASGGTIEISDLDTRTGAAEEAFIAVHDALKALVKSGEAADPSALQAAMLRMHDFGLSGAIPVTADDDALARVALLQQAGALLKESEARKIKSAALRGLSPEPDPRRRRNQLFDRLRAVFGEGMPVTARFRAAPDAAQALRQALEASTRIQGDDPLAVYTWFLRGERVREGLGRFGAPLRAAEILGLRERLDLHVAQLPYDSADRWAGLPPTAGKPIPAGQLSLVVQATDPIDTDQTLSGLWIDDWVEIVPNRSEATAVTFQYNAPDACAPQTVLLAVPPDPAEPWTVATLYRVLVETLDLAKLRAVPLEEIGEIAQYLPATFVAMNAGNDVVSTDLGPLTE